MIFVYIINTEKVFIFLSNVLDPVTCNSNM